MILRIVAKDLSLLWPLALLSIGLTTVAQVLASANLVPHDGSQVQETFVVAIFLASLAGIFALVGTLSHLDPIPGVRQDWLVRPVRRGQMLVAKVAFLLLAVHLPILILSICDALAAGLPLSDAFAAGAARTGELLVIFTAPALALAAMMSSLLQMIVGALVLLVLFAATHVATAVFFGQEYCSTCGTGVHWLQTSFEGIELIVGSAAVLGLQYLRRRTAWSMALTLFGVVVFVLAQLSWKEAFAIQQRLSAAPGASQQISIAAAPGESGAGRPTPAAHTNRDELAIVAARSLLRGDPGDEERNSQVRRAAAANTLRIPLDVEGLGPGQLLLVDRAEVTLTAADGSVVYSGLGDPFEAVPAADGSARIWQHVRLPAQVYALATSSSRSRAVSARIDYSLTIFASDVPQLLGDAMAARRVAGMGRCRAAPPADYELSLSCISAGSKPSCFAVSRVGEAMDSTPLVVCYPGYTPFPQQFPAPLNRYGIDVPLDVAADATKSATALKVWSYRPLEHFTRHLTARIGSD